MVALRLGPRQRQSADAPASGPSRASRAEGVLGGERPAATSASQWPPGRKARLRGLTSGGSSPSPTRRGGQGVRFLPHANRVSALDGRILALRAALPQPHALLAGEHAALRWTVARLAAAGSGPRHW